MIKAEIILDSITRAGARLTTFVLTYPRFVHAEFMTHRAVSKNSASSRAIPNSKMIQDITDNPAMPAYWGRNQRGMQAGDELSPEEIQACKKEWLALRDNAIAGSKSLADLGLAKQLCNRPLEPWFHMRVLASATDWDNFFFLRCHKGAQPEICALADAMLYQYVNHTPQLVEDGGWHLPFTDRNVPDNVPLALKQKISMARSARVSYLNFEGNSEPEKDVELHDRLIASSPGHWSPAEHLAEALDNLDRHGNFVGWRQYRKFFDHENIEGDLRLLLNVRAAQGSLYAQGRSGEV